jgi:hypothetical protein
MAEQIGERDTADTLADLEQKVTPGDEALLASSAAFFFFHGRS